MPHTELLSAVKALNAPEVRRLLDCGVSSDFLDESDRTLLHTVIDSPDDDDAYISVCNSDCKSAIIYMLVDANVDLEAKDRDGNTCLYYAVRNCDFKSSDILLLCGADMYSICESGKSILEEVFAPKHHKIINENELDEENELHQVFKKHYPGLWRAVEVHDIGQVRRLTNLWCRTDLIKDGKTLKELALDTGHEEIISFVYGIHDTMKLIHHMFAKNAKAVEGLLQNSRKTIRLDIRKMSERGAPILYYLIQWKDAAMVELFVKHGCHVYTIMRDEWGYDMPVLFSALHPSMPVDVIKALLPSNKYQQEEMLYKLLYKGRTVLEVALQNHVSLDVFDVIVDRGGPLVVMDRNEFNQSVRDIAVMEGRFEYADVIDKNVLSWIAHPKKYSGRRLYLALYGWDHFDDLPVNDPQLDGNQDALEFLNRLEALQDQIKDLVDAVEKGDGIEFHQLRTFSFGEHLYDHILSWDGRLQGDGMPLLHRAVLFNQSHLVACILNDKPRTQSIDTLFDQHHRTALHYAYACPDNSEVIKMLLANGCCEHVLDRNNKEPLDFKDKQDTEMMGLLIERLKTKSYGISEPNPWENEFSGSFNENEAEADDHDYPKRDRNLAADDAGEDKSAEESENSQDEYVENDTESEPEPPSWSCSIL